LQAVLENHLNPTKDEDKMEFPPRDNPSVGEDGWAVSNEPVKSPTAKASANIKDNLDKDAALAEFEKVFTDNT
jgi:hypothetical protein